MRQIVRQIPRKLIIVFTLMLCVVCMRVLLPRPLQAADLIHLAKVVVFYQNFPVHEPDTISDAVTSLPVEVDVDAVKRYVRTSSQKIKIPSTFPKEFISPMTLKDKIDLLVTLEVFLKICKRNNFTVFANGGTLLGTYRHQGLIPWDDDFDIVMNASDWRRIRHVFSKVPGYEILALRYHQWKFYKADLPSIPDKPFKWPFIDIFFFTEDAEYIWALTGGIKDQLFAKKSDFFPLKYQPFEYLKMPMPCNWVEITTNQFNVDKCVSSSYNHKLCKYITKTKTKHCQFFQNVYPFVSRTKGVERTVEVLKIGETIMRNISYKNECGL